jgi:thiol-disulfide isomerase/thioredoxin
MTLGLVACGNKIITPVEEIVEDNTEEKMEDNTEEKMEDITEGEEFKEFTAVDIYGNVVTEDIIKDKKLVMINIWGTFCGPCLSEMPYLGELAEEYADKDVIIIGICVDINEDSGQETAIKIVEDTGANYTHLMVSDDLNDIYISGVQLIPETLFLDSSGTIIDSVIGSLSKEEWKKVIDSYLNK